MNILQSVTSHKFSRPTGTFQEMSQILVYFKLIAIIMFEKLLRYVRPSLYVTTYWSQPRVLEGKQILSSTTCSFNEDSYKLTS